VYRWGDEALVQTVDFFTPIVDDPFQYGQIAAANALSDVYAMGGEPRTALAVAGFPREGLDSSVIREIFRGGLEMLRSADVALLGGHTVQDTEVKFGYAITGVVDPARILRNAGALAGDVVILTKPIGTGIVATAVKFGRAPAAVADAAVRSMTTLNRAAAGALRSLERGAVHACTDVTGFGLIGHASEMAAASGVVVEIDVGRVPIIDGVRDLVRRNTTRGGGSNEEHFGGRVEGAHGIDRAMLTLLYDPQTSGGLLAALAPGAAGVALAALDAAGVAAVRIGRVASPANGVAIRLLP
jgi:selenide,water dikinase